MGAQSGGVGYIDARLHEVSPWDGKGGSVKPGGYIFKITDVEQGTSKRGKPKLVCSLEVIEAADPANDDEVGSVLKDSWSLDMENETVRKRLRARVEACLGELDQRGGFDPQALVGCEYYAEVSTQPYEDKDPVSGTTTVKNSTQIAGELPADQAPGFEADGDDDEGQEAAEPEPEPEPPKKKKKAATRKRKTKSANNQPTT